VLLNRWWLHGWCGYCQFRFTVAQISLLKSRDGSSVFTLISRATGLCALSFFFAAILSATLSSILFLLLVAVDKTTPTPIRTAAKIEILAATAFVFRVPSHWSELSLPMCVLATGTV